MPAEPTADDLAEAARGPGDRYGAEVFALTTTWGGKVLYPDGRELKCGEVPGA